jgi:hypothetical protein
VARYFPARASRPAWAEPILDRGLARHAPPAQLARCRAFLLRVSLTGGPRASGDVVFLPKPATDSPFLNYRNRILPSISPFLPWNCLRAIKTEPVILPLHPILTWSFGTIPRRHCSEHRHDRPPYRAVRRLLVHP